MPAAPFWEDDYESWNQVSLAGQVFPGVAKVTGGISRKLDVKAAKGKDGARVTDGGYENGKFAIEIRIHNRDEFALLQPRLDAINPRQRGSARTAVDIAHPSLVFLGVSAVYVEKVGVPELANGVLTVKIDVVEWVPIPRSRPRTNASTAVTASVETVEQNNARSRGAVRAIPSSNP